MIKIGNKNEKLKAKIDVNYCRHFLILPLFRNNHLITLLQMAKMFLWLHETIELINEFGIVYMINTTLHVNKAFK